SAAARVLDFWKSPHVTASQKSGLIHAWNPELALPLATGGRGHLVGGPEGGFWFWCGSGRRVSCAEGRAGGAGEAAGVHHDAGAAGGGVHPHESELGEQIQQRFLHTRFAGVLGGQQVQDATALLLFAAL